MSDSGYPDNYGPKWKASTDITPTLDAYNWMCQKCEGSSPAFTRRCQWCGQERTNGNPVTAFADLPPKRPAESVEPEKTVSELGELLMEVWQNWFEFDGDPWIFDDYGGQYCFFCVKDYPDHAQDCAYDRAKKLLGIG